jgi:hypothetical protein
LVTGVVSGFDRLVFRGSLLRLYRDGGMFLFLQDAGVRLLDYRNFVMATSERVKQAAHDEATKLGRPIHYLLSSQVSKEELARELLARHPIERGLVCLMSAVETCVSFEYHRSTDPSQRGLRLHPTKCLHLYKYYLHPRFGFMNIRLQTWFPFNVQICLNGREWLAGQLRSRCSRFKRVDNCFTWLSNPGLAQRLMDEQLTTEWPETLDALARMVNPLHDAIFEPAPMEYYWSGYQTEWASDILFRNPAALASIYPALVRHAMEHFKSPDVMRFLARKAHGNYTGEITSSFKDRAEGVRVKHWLNGNSIKMYDKAGSVLRVETTIGRASDFKVFRPPHDDPNGPLGWRPLRKGVADLHRRAKLSQRSNETYLDALASVADSTPCHVLFDAVARPITDRGRRFRALSLSDPSDLALLEHISRGEFSATGLRNRDLRRLLAPTPVRPNEMSSFSAKTSRLLRLLRAHAILRKIPKTHRYRVTDKGRLLTTALFATRRANITQLLSTAA